ncbi:MAG: hypothetical protein R6U46_13375 [Marinilabilia sp.]
MRTWVIVLGILLVLALAAMIMYMVKGGNLKSEVQTLEEEKTTLQDEREQIQSERDASQQEITDLEARMEELKAEHEEELEERDNLVTSLRGRIQGVNELKEEIEAYKEMEAEYEELQDRHAELKSERDSLDQERRQMVEKFEVLKDSVKRSQDLNAYHISPLTKWERWLWADRYNISRAGRVDETTVSFEIGGTLFSETGERTVYLNMVNPEGEVMYPSGETFEKEETGEESPYTRKKEIEYTGDDLPVNFTIEHENSLEPGTYQLEVYINGRMKKATTLELE